MKIARNGLYAAVSVAALVLVLGAPAPVQAQSSGMSVKVPFDFHVGFKPLPAGTYTVEKRGDVLSLRGSGGSAFVLTNAVQGRAGGDRHELVFNGYSGSFFLSEARWGDRSTGVRLIQSPEEVKFASKISAKPVSVAANINSSR